MNLDRIRNLNGFLRQIFGTRVHKVCLIGGFTCPNRDGNAGIGGCSFCNPAGSMPMTWREGMSVSQQLARGCDYVGRTYGVNRFLAYFQDYSTTYGDPEELGRLYSEALAFPGIVGLCICTRPDCLDGDILDLLRRISERTFLWVEIGVQTSNDAVLMDMNRCHSSSDTVSAFTSLHSKGILTAAHMLIGYPGWDLSDISRDAQFVAGSGCRGLKLQNLHVIRDTPLARRYLEDGFRIMTMEEYTDSVILFLENTDPGVVIQRLTGEAMEALTVAPDWSLEKQSVLLRIRRELETRDTWQGKTLGCSIEDVSVPFEPVAEHWYAP